MEEEGGVGKRTQYNQQAGEIKRKTKVYAPWMPRQVRHAELPKAKSNAGKYA